MSVSDSGAGRMSDGGTGSVSDRGAGSEPHELEEPDRSLTDLTSRLASDVGDLVSTHIDLAKAEIKEEVQKAGKGAGLLGGGAFAGFMAVILLSFALAWGLAEVMPAGFAFLIVGALWAIAAAVLAVMGRNKMQEVEPTPTQTMDEIQEDKQWLSRQTS